MKFSIRDLLWLTLGCALAVGWWVEHYAAARTKRERDRASFNERLLNAYRQDGRWVEVIESDGTISLHEFKDGLPSNWTTGKPDNVPNRVP